MVFVMLWLRLLNKYLTPKNGTITNNPLQTAIKPPLLTEKLVSTRIRTQGLLTPKFKNTHSIISQYFHELNYSQQVSSAMFWLFSSMQKSHKTTSFQVISISPNIWNTPPKMTHIIKSTEKSKSRNSYSLMLGSDLQRQNFLVLR